MARSWDSAAPASWAARRRLAYSGGRCWVMRRIRPSSLVPGAAVNPNRARVSMTRPVDFAALSRARLRTRGCQRRRTSPSRRAERAYFGLLDLVLHVALDGPLGDVEEGRHCLGGLELFDEEAHLSARRFGDGAGEVLFVGAAEAVADLGHGWLLLPIGRGVVALDVAGRVVSFVEHLDGPQEGLGALVLDHAGTDPEAEPSGQRLALGGAGEEVERAGTVGEVDRAVGEHRDGVRGRPWWRACASCGAC